MENLRDPSPEVSIAICFKNPGKPFHLAIKSIFAQSFTDWELILMDDNSTDGSLEYARNLNDPRVRVYNDGKSKPLSARINEAVALAAGKYFFRMDSDDIMHPERVKRQVAVLRESAPDTVVGSAVYSVDEGSHIHGVHGYPGPRKTGFSARHAFQHPTVAAYTVWFRKHPYDEKLARSEDAELWCRTASTSSFVTLPQPLLYYREVGVFNLDKHLESVAALLQILRRHYRRPRARFVFYCTVELLKTWIYLVADTLNRANTIRRKYRNLSDSDRETALRGLAIVLEQRVPMKD